MKITLIVPVCNPRAELFRTLVALHQAGAVRVVFVDDGTTMPASAAMLKKAQSLGCVVVDMPEGAKTGNAAKRGLLYYLHHTIDHAGAITVGQNMALSEDMLKRIARKMPRSGQALVLGVRDEEALTPDERRRSERAQELLREYDCRVADPLSGVCLFSNALAYACVKLPQEGTSWQVNLLLAAVQNKVALYEVPLFEKSTDEKPDQAVEKILQEISALTPEQKAVVHKRLTQALIVQQAPVQTAPTEKPPAVVIQAEEKAAVSAPATLPPPLSLSSLREVVQQVVQEAEQEKANTEAVKVQTVANTADETEPPATAPQPQPAAGLESKPQNEAADSAEKPHDIEEKPSLLPLSELETQTPQASDAQTTLAGQEDPELPGAWEGFASLSFEDEDMDFMPSESGEESATEPQIIQETENLLFETEDFVSVDSFSRAASVLNAFEDNEVTNIKEQEKTPEEEPLYEEKKSPKIAQDTFEKLANQIYSAQETYDFIALDPDVVQENIQNEMLLPMLGFEDLADAIHAEEPQMQDMAAQEADTDSGMDAVADGAVEVPNFAAPQKWRRKNKKKK